MITFPDRSLIMQVISSWQVIFITVVVVLYLSLVYYVVKYRKKVVIPKTKTPKAPKPPKVKKSAGKSEEDEDE
jgi:Ca2+/Na+ antiporter